ncbi:MAG: GNAT family N-acetyltransferase [Fimbriimonas sp.]
MIQIREVPHGSPEYRQTVELRRAVLRIPLGLDLSEEELAAESNEIHLAAFEDDHVIACLVLVPMPDGEIKMRQVAVRPDLQGTGIGTRLVQASEDLARQRALQTMTLHSRDTAVRFYERMGYQIEGEMFEEVTIPHFGMFKRLNERDI